MEIFRHPLDFPRETSWLYERIANSHSGPQYTCPSCREVVTRRPVEDFKVKALVSWLGSVQGIEPPEGESQPGPGNTLFDSYPLL
jgi:hypothetical protein